MQILALVISILAVSITVVGWYVTYRLNVRTQKRVLLNALTNEARQVLIDAIRDLHDWLCELHVQIAAMPADDIASLGQDTELHRRRKLTLVELSLDSRQLTWAKRLEEYVLLFPHTTRIRIDLLNSTSVACGLVRKLADQHEQGSAPSNEDRKSCTDPIMDILALATDLLIYIQNESIGHLIGKRIAQRVPLDPAAVRLSVDSRGELVIVRPGKGLAC